MDKVISTYPCTPRLAVQDLSLYVFTGMRLFGAFRLPAEPHAVTQGFVLFKMDKNIIFLYQYLGIHKKTPIHTGVPLYLCTVKL